MGKLKAMLIDADGNAISEESMCWVEEQLELARMFDMDFDIEAGRMRKPLKKRNTWFQDRNADSDNRPEDPEQADLEDIR